MYDVTAVGEVLIDFVPQSNDEAGHPTLAAKPGGAPGNFLAALQKFGGLPVPLPAFLCRARGISSVPELSDVLERMVCVS